MGSGDQWDVNEEPRARRFTLVPGAARIPGPHEAPKLDLIVNAERKLYEAVMANDPRRVSTWLARGADPNARDPDGRTALFEAMLTLKDKDAAIAEQLLDGGADVHVRDRDGQTPLHAAAAYGDEAHMRVLLEHRAEIDARDAAGQTPLHKAAGLGRVEATTYLVGRGADVAICDHDGRTPLHHVLMDRHLEEHLREPLERLLWGFMTARIVEARQDSLIVRVEGFHSKYPEAEREAAARGTLTVPCGIFRDVPEPGDLLRCRKGLSQALDEAWSSARRYDLGITPKR